MSYILILLGWVFFSEALILILSRDRKEQPLTHILVLGANGDGHSVVNRERAEKALQAKARYPNAQIIVSGNELARGEVTALLQNLGSHADGVIKEELSTTTWENIELSKTHLDPDANVLLVTSDFHTPRALAVARLLGLQATAPQHPIVEQRKVGWWTRERFAVAIFVVGFLYVLSRRYFKR